MAIFEFPRAGWLGPGGGLVRAGEFRGDMSRQCYVYIVTNKGNEVLYTGVTNDLARRMWEHQNGMAEGFTSRYQTGRLVYYEVFDDPEAAITREKQLKKGPRKGKIELIEAMNPGWRDLGEELFGWE